MYTSFTLFYPDLETSKYDIENFTWDKQILYNH